VTPVYLHIRAFKKYVDNSDEYSYSTNVSKLKSIDQKLSSLESNRLANW
jgi:hypothetical protein